MSEIRVTVAGAKGKMGQEVVKMVLDDPEFTLAAAVDSHLHRVPVSEMLSGIETHAMFYQSLEEALNENPSDVFVDFTRPQVVQSHAETAIRMGVRPVLGTTGLSTEAITSLDQLCTKAGIGGMMAPNFAIGAVLLMHFAAQAAKYMPQVEIIDFHHDQKLDAPSGTAIKTAEMIAAVRQEFKQGHPDEKETIEGVRGGYYQGFRLHSVRMTGYVAHQEVLFGAPGQTLTLRHDSIHRASFMPGVNLAIKKVMTYTGLLYGLENILDVS